MPRKKNAENNSITHFEKEQIQCIVSARNDEQRNLLKTINDKNITFVKGFPGTGKTFVSVTYGLQQLCRKKYEKLIFSRPVVEAAGERLGFLPGDVSSKIDPYMIPIFDTLSQFVSHSLLTKMMMKNGHDPSISILPLAFMRGLTFNNSYVVVDEAQNTTPEQMRMLLTRLGSESKLVICGDVYQSDIRHKNGLEDAFELLSDIDEIGFVTLTKKSIVRHPIISKIEDKYQKRIEEQKAK